VSVPWLYPDLCELIMNEYEYEYDCECVSEYVSEYVSV
jgi:hypothetical protein